MDAADTPVPMVPDDATHLTTIIHHVLLGTNEIICWARRSPAANWEMVRTFTVRADTPIQTDPDWAPDGQYRGRHPIKMPSTGDLVVPTDPRSLTDIQGGIQTGKLGDPGSVPPVPFNFPNAPGTPGYSPPPG